MQVTLIDSPVANVASIERALRATGALVTVASDRQSIAAAEKLVLPGVGSFTAAMRWLTTTGIDEAIRSAVHRGASLLGICVGHQLLFDESHEMGITPGLGLVRGTVRRFETVLPVPQIGWNRVWWGERSALSNGVPNGTSFYFVNSYAASDAHAQIARADYDGSFCAALQQDRVFGVQFHPEKSSAAGLQVLRNFVAWT